MLEWSTLLLYIHGAACGIEVVLLAFVAGAWFEPGLSLNRVAERCPRLLRISVNSRVSSCQKHSGIVIMSD